MLRHRIRRPRECVGLDRSLLDAVDVALITCVEVGFVKRIHTVFGRTAQQVVYEIQMREEVGGVRQEVREVKGEEKGEIKVEGEQPTS